MRKIVVYFHGYGSNPNSEKVDRIHMALPEYEVYAFDIDIDVDKAYAHLSAKIDEVLTMVIHSNCELVFVETSLGGWWASKMAEAYGAKAIIINPSSNPKDSLLKHGVSEDLCAKYDSLKINDRFHYFFSVHDEVIDHDQTIREVIELGASYYLDKNEDHHFNGDGFNRVISTIREIS